MLNKRLLIFVPPPSDISKRIYDLNKLISSKYANSYMAHANFEWQSHVMVYLSLMPVKNISKILRILENEVVSKQAFTLELGKIITTSEGFLFIEIIGSALFELNAQLIKDLKPLRSVEIKDEYLQKWDEYSKEDKQRIKDTGLPYVYQPHLTIAKVAPAEASTALGLLDINEFSGRSFVANNVLAVLESDSPQIDWPVVGSFKLN